MPNKIYCVSYADERMTIAQKKLEESFLSVPHAAGLERLTMGFNETDLHPEFSDLMRKKGLAGGRGAGYWIWKPWVIQEAMHRIEGNQYILYADSGIEIIQDISCLLSGDPEIVLFENKWPHLDWCKRSTLEAMLVPSLIPDRSYNQCQASVCVFKKTLFTVEFLRKWNWWCQIGTMIDDTPSMDPEIPTFVEHRHDQAILTNLAILYHIPRHWWPSNTYVGFRALYPQDAHWPALFNHHRKRNEEW